MEVRKAAIATPTRWAEEISFRGLQQRSFLDFVDFRFAQEHARREDRVNVTLLNCEVHRFASDGEIEID